MKSRQRRVHFHSACATENGSFDKDGRNASDKDGEMQWIREEEAV